MTAYDEVIYPGRAYPDTHPEHLATIGRLFGMLPAPVARCRVLEVACGDAANIIPMAYGLPESRFVGLDLAATAIDIGKRMADRLGLANLSLLHCDLQDFPCDAGRFDYIIAHGLYSWVPAGVRDRLLGLIGHHLAPAGIAVVSYNTYPGCYMRRMVWEVLRFHTDHLPDPRARIAEARTLAGLLGTSRGVAGTYGAQLAADLERVAQRDAEHVLHDDLAEVNDPVYFHEFVEHAGRHRLQFLGEGELKAMSYAGLDVSVRAVLKGFDPLTREQYLDFFRFRRFRQTLLCHDGIELNRNVGLDRIGDFLLSAPPSMRVRVSRSADAEAADSGAGSPGKEGVADEALLQAVLDVLDEAAPGRLAFAEVVERVKRKAAGAALDEPSEDGLRRLVLGAVWAGAVEPHISSPRLALEPSERPQASALARLQLESGPIVTSLCHDSVKLDDELGRKLVSLLDGTRDRDALVRALGDQLDSDPVARHAALEAHLRLLARLALLVA
jgi:methyltransferase-like protein/SAM-dependent methyltransferase